MIIVAPLFLLVALVKAQPPCIQSIWFEDGCVRDCPPNFYYSNENGYYECK